MKVLLDSWPCLSYFQNDHVLNLIFCKKDKSHILPFYAEKLLFPVFLELSKLALKGLRWREFKLDFRCSRPPSSTSHVRRLWCEKSFNDLVGITFCLFYLTWESFLENLNINHLLRHYICIDRYAATSFKYTFLRRFSGCGNIYPFFLNWEGTYMSVQNLLASNFTLVYSIKMQYKASIFQCSKVKFKPWTFQNEGLREGLGFLCGYEQ